MTVASFPAHVPTERTFQAGDFPVKTFKSINGAEYRILYGNTRTNMTLELTYANIKDSIAKDFLNHYELAKGTFNEFDVLEGTKSGWTAEASLISATGAAKFRYESAPQVVQVRKGISTVTVKLIGVT